MNQTLALSVTATLILLLKKLFEDKLSPRWQFGVWSIFTLRLLLPVGLFHRYLFPQGQVLLAWIKNIVEEPPYSALSAPYEAVAVTAPVPLFPDGFSFPGSVTDWLFYLYSFGVAISLLWLAGTYLVLRREVARGHAAGAAETAQVQAVAEAYSLPLPRRIVVLPQCGPGWESPSCGVSTGATPWCGTAAAGCETTAKPSVTSGCWSVWRGRRGVSTA